MIDVSSIYRRQPQGLRQGVALAVVLSLALAGCERPLNGAIDLFHNLEGGPIADQRPPPPGVDSPYPNLGTTPKRPLAADAAAQQQIGDSLAAQRDAATAAAAADPLKPLPPVTPPPKPQAVDPNANKVVVDAAPSPPPPPPAKQAAPAGTGTDAFPAIVAPVASGPLPDIAAAPPAGPVGLGITVPLPPPTPNIVVKPPAAVPNGVAVAFTPGSSTLPPSANLRLRRYALAHHGSQFTVTGRGDGGWRSPDAQSRAMELGLKRAAAIAVSLGGTGVPTGNIHIRADAVGTDSIATLN